MFCNAGSDDEEDEAGKQPDDQSAANSSADAVLRDFRYTLQCQFMEPQRDLKARMIQHMFFLQIDCNVFWQYVFVVNKNGVYLSWKSRKFPQGSTTACGFRSILCLWSS